MAAKIVNKYRIDALEKGYNVTLKRNNETEHIGFALILSFIFSLGTAYIIYLLKKISNETFLDERSMYFDKKSVDISLSIWLKQNGYQDLELPIREEIRRIERARNGQVADVELNSPEMLSPVSEKPVVVKDSGFYLFLSYDQSKLIVNRLDDIMQKFSMKYKIPYSKDQFIKDLINQQYFLICTTSSANLIREYQQYLESKKVATFIVDEEKIDEFEKNITTNPISYSIKFIGSSLNIKGNKAIKENNISLLKKEFPDSYVVLINGGSDTDKIIKELNILNSNVNHSAWKGETITNENYQKAKINEWFPYFVSDDEIDLDAIEHLIRQRNITFKRVKISELK